MERITIKHLTVLADRINIETGSPRTYWVDPSADSRKTSIGHYHIDSAYGGWALDRTCNAQGGVSDILGRGHVPARELYELMHAFLRGFRAAQDMRQQVRP